jgi:hypothetical protein
VTGPARLRPRAFAAPSDPARLLSAVADALNALENAGITVDLAGGAVMTPRGYVMAVGDDRLGSKWQARTRLWTPLQPPDDSSDDD